MLNGKTAKEYKELRRLFAAMPMEYRPVPFYHMDGCFAENGVLCEDAAKNIVQYKKSGYGGLCPLPVSAAAGHRATSPEFGTADYYDSYKALLDKAKELDMRIIFYDDLDFPTGRAGGEMARAFPGSTARMLCRYEYECMEGQKICRELHSGGDVTLMSLVAVEVDDRHVIDLREFIEDDCVCWTVPDGNWNIEEYVCTSAENGYVNYMNYDACMDYISLTYKRFADRYQDYIGDVVNMTFFDDLQYQAPNRRMWDDRFNEIFEEKYGFDPAPCYPALWEDIGEDTPHYKALLMDCRAHMFADGFFKAVGDFTRRNALASVGHVAEPKDASGSWLYGDHFLWRRHGGAVGLDLIHAYMYGFNGLKLASSAAYNYDIDTVACEIYGAYRQLDRRILYCEAMNAFAKGVNFMIPHTLWLSGHARIPHEVSHRNYKFKADVPELLDYMTRCQTLLRGGRHIADIAVLYPIHSIHSQEFLYESEPKGWEFSTTPANADYVTLINTITAFSGRDVTVIHPEVMSERMTADDGMLYLNNTVNFERYRVLFMPGMSMISLDNLRMIKKFWEGGGILIATVELPSRAMEFTPDKNADAEVRRIIGEIFGTSGTDRDSMTERLEKHNENGGIAYFLPSDKTAADGVYHVDSKAVDEILDNLPVVYDVEMLNIPRLDDQGMLSLILPAFVNHGVADALIKGGVFSYIHKRQENCDVYFFANSTAADYDGRVLLRGEHNPELWNPHTGKIRRADYELVNWRGEVYTKVALKLASAESVFIVSSPEKELLDIIRDAVDPRTIEVFVADENKK
ncbi:MAG: hypothetical protein E7632_04020 [Ruminococcaceae bacterium]|nr:hypothetical protein [Oscillospiraceae bacterium]